MSSQKFNIAALALAFATLGAISGAHAQAQPWNGSATIYGWLPAITGSEEGRDGTPIIDVPGPDVLEALNFAFYGMGEVRRDKLGFMFDVAYADLGSDGEVSDPVDISADLGTKIYFASAAASWRIHEASGAYADIYGGIRATGVEIDFTASLADLAGGRKGTANWVDPIIGLRGFYPITEKVSVSGRADFGGFGVGSELTWQAIGVVNYAFSDAWLASLGYRYMSIEYEGDRLGLDIDLQGPMLGLTYVF